MNRIKEIRLQKGMKQKDPALQIGLTKSAVSMYENGKGRPSMNTASKIAQVLDVTIEELFYTALEAEETKEVNIF